MPCDLAGALEAGQPCDQVQRHVDAGGDAGRRDDVAVVDEPGVAADLDGRVESRQQVEAFQYVVAGPASSPAAA